MLDEYKRASNIFWTTKISFFFVLVLHACPFIDKSKLFIVSKHLVVKMVKLKIRKIKGYHCSHLSNSFLLTTNKVAENGNLYTKSANPKERKEKERKGKKRKGKERKGKERKGKGVLK